ncbi:MAG TPA: glycosyltransferase family 2 protein [Bacteroidota bacterium]|nr:glycosyltransferase family 2 protein [Bacteroidota bacterium]
MIYAPVLLFVYNRPRHTQRTLEALRKNTLAAQTDLYIQADGARNEADRAAVELVRAFLSNVEGFQTVKVIAHDQNRGLAESVIKGVTDVVDKHGRVIVVEDDLETSPYFLQYMNDGLNLYEAEENVISIHGYLYPLTTSVPETFFLKGADCWGWATWKRGWDLFERDGEKLLRELRSRGLEHEFDLNGSYHYAEMLKDQCAGKIDSWAIRWHASAFLKNKFTLYPGRSLVYNIGHDSSGSHSETMDAFNVTLSETPIRVAKMPITQDGFVLKEVCRYWRSVEPNAIQRVIRHVQKLFTGRHR